MQVSAQLEALRQPLHDLARSSLEEGWEGAMELVNIAVQALRSVWPIKSPNGEWVYSQRRTAHFLQVQRATLAAACRTARSLYSMALMLSYMLCIECSTFFLWQCNGAAAL